jgi:hypothetical protein
MTPADQALSPPTKLHTPAHAIAIDIQRNAEYLEMKIRSTDDGGKRTESICVAWVVHMRRCIKHTNQLHGVERFGLWALGLDFIKF